MPNIARPVKDINEDFRLLKSINDDVWLAERKSDNQPFIARRLEEFDGLIEAVRRGNDVGDSRLDDIRGLAGLLSDCGMDTALAQLLNHENLVSLAGVINEKHTKASQYSDRVQRIWLVWDYCDGGNLQELFLDGHVALEHTPYYYMPEDLCWHVLRSVLRGLVWLQTGQRFFCAEDKPYVQDLRAVDDDWYPILHGGVKPENIFFQLPRGGEKYGPCKLGNFSKAFISGKQCREAMPLPKKGGEGRTGLVASLRDGKMASWNHIRYSWCEDRLNAPKTLYTFDEELWNLGSIVYRMMAGHEPPSFRGCEDCDYHHSHAVTCTYGEGKCFDRSQACQCSYGGCKHRKSSRCHQVVRTECRRCVPGGGGKCKSTTDSHFQAVLYTKHYSTFLIRAVLGLLSPYTTNTSLRGINSGPRIMLDVEDQYSQWLERTEEGRDFYGIDDDLLSRCRDESGLKKSKRALFTWAGRGVVSDEEEEEEEEEVEDDADMDADDGGIS